MFKFFDKSRQTKKSSQREHLVFESDADEGYVEIRGPNALNGQFSPVDSQAETAIAFLRHSNALSRSLHRHFNLEGSPPKKMRRPPEEDSPLDFVL